MIPHNAIEKFGLLGIKDWWMCGGRFEAAKAAVWATNIALSCLAMQAMGNPWQTGLLTSFAGSLLIRTGIISPKQKGLDNFREVFF